MPEQSSDEANNKDTETNAQPVAENNAEAKDVTSELDLDLLGEKISSAKATYDKVTGRLNTDAPANKDSLSSGMGMGFRMAVEMVAAVVVGLYLGYVLDKWLDSKPLFTLSLLLLGIVTGFWNIIRAAQKFDKKYD